MQSDQNLRFLSEAGRFRSLTNHRVTCDDSEQTVQSLHWAHLQSMMCHATAQMCISSHYNTTQTTLLYFVGNEYESISP